METILNKQIIIITLINKNHPNLIQIGGKLIAI